MDIFFNVCSADVAAANFVDKFASESKTGGDWDFLFSCSLMNWFYVVVLIGLFGLPNFSEYSWYALGAGVVVAGTGWFYLQAINKRETSRMVILFQIIPLVSAALALENNILVPVPMC